MKRISLPRVFVCCASIGLLAAYVTVWLPFGTSPLAKRADFLIYYTAGKLPLNKLYNVDAQRDVQIQVLGSPVPIKGGVLPFNHAPLLVPLLHILVNDDYAASYFRWTLLMWPIIMACAFLVFKMTGDPALAFASGSFYPVFISIMKGHDTALVLLGGLLCAYLLSLHRDLLAGVALSLATLKPHLAIFLAVPLVARPKALLGFAVASALLGLYSLLLVGVGGVSDFVTLLTLSTSGEQLEMRPLAMFNLLGLMERAGVPPATARPIAWAVFFLSALVLVAIWKRNPSSPPFALTILLAIFTSPHLHGHDLALLVIFFATVSNINALLVLVSSVALAVFDFMWTDWRYAVAQVLIATLLLMAIKDARTRHAAIPQVQPDRLGARA